MNATEVAETISRLQKHTLPELEMVVTFGFAAIQTKKQEYMSQAQAQVAFVKQIQEKPVVEPVVEPVIESVSRQPSYFQILKKSADTQVQVNQTKNFDQVSEEFERVHNAIVSPKAIDYDTSESDEYTNSVMTNFCGIRNCTCAYTAHKFDDPALADPSLIDGSALFLEGLPIHLIYSRIRSEIYNIINNEVNIKRTIVPGIRCSHNRGSYDDKGKKLQCNNNVAIKGDYCEEHGGKYCDTPGNMGIAIMMFNNHKDAVKAWKILKSNIRRKESFLDDNVFVNFFTRKTQE